MEDMSRLRRIVQEEVERLIPDIHEDAVDSGHVPARRRLLPGVLWGMRILGGVALGLLCGVLSHVAVVMFSRLLQ